LGDVAFAVRQINRDNSEVQGIMRGAGKKPDTIATTADGFNRFGFEPTVNNSGVVAFKAKLNTIDTFDFESGLFSGQDGKQPNITTYYRSSTSQFSEFGSLSRPSINNLGNIAFEEAVDGTSASGIFVTAGAGFTTIAAADPNVIVGRPNLNDAGSVTFHRFFNDRAGEELVRSDGGTLTVMADTSGPFQSFGFTFTGFTPPALNNNGETAFLADLDSGGSGIFVGPDAVADRVIATGDTLDGSTVTGLRFCDEGLNDSGQLAFQATFNDPSVPEGIRVAIYRASRAP
jgi:3',5'-cyclic AMP phosphodiesterase CpdA